MSARSEEEFDENEAGLLLQDLLRSLEYARPDDSISAAIAFFKNVGSCTHVLGTSYSYILESIHNRKSFVYCLHEGMRGYSDDHEVTPTEFHMLVDTLFPGFPRSVTIDAVICATENYVGSMPINEMRYLLVALVKTLSFQVLYDDWLRLAEEVFKGDGGRGNTTHTNGHSSISMNSGSNGVLLGNIFRVRSSMENLQRTSAISVYQPPLHAVVTTLESYEGNRNGGDISFHRFKSSICAHGAVQTELQLLTRYPSLV